MTPYRLFRFVRDTIRGKNDEVWELLNDKEFLGAARNRALTYTTDYAYSQRPRRWDGLPGGHPVFQHMLAARDDCYAALIDSFVDVAEPLNAIGRNLPDDSMDPDWDNPWFGPGDAIALYCLLATQNPKRYVEIGSGNSTKFARRAILDHNLQTRIVSIDPAPRRKIDALCDEIIRERLEDANLDVFGDLEPGDLLFIDCSHRSYQNSDVTVFFTEVLPGIPDNVIWGLHDIFIPFDYPEVWLSKHERYYNEQYLLMSYLLGGGGRDEIFFPVLYLRKCKPEAYASFMDSFKANPPWGNHIPSGGSFWMRRTQSS